MQNVYAGKLIRNAELKEVGEKKFKKTQFTLNVGKDQDLVTCVAWFEMADETADLKKGDRVMVVGTMNSREFNGKTFRDVDVQFVVRHNAVPVTQPKADIMDGFKDIQSEDIPF